MKFVLNHVRKSRVIKIKFNNNERRNEWIEMIWNWQINICVGSRETIQSVASKRGVFRCGMIYIFFIRLNNGLCPKNVFTQDYRYYWCEKYDYKKFFFEDLKWSDE